MKDNTEKENTNLNDKFELAKVAYKGNNYSDAYKKYSSIVEENIENKKAWIGKGLSAGRVATPDKNTLKEAEISLKKAVEMGLNEDEKKYISDEILDISKEFIENTNKSVANILMQKDKKPMATGELYSIRQLGKVADRLKAFNNHWEYYKDAINFSKLALDFNDSLTIKKGILKNIDLILNESKKDFHKNYLGKLEKWRRKTIKSIREDEPKFDVPEVKDNSGCFIATAAYGSYNSPTVIELRKFRDLYLEKNIIGKIFIQLYYSTSPPIANVIKNNSILKTLTRAIINNIILKITRFLISK